MRTRDDAMVAGIAAVPRRRGVDEVQWVETESSDFDQVSFGALFTLDAVFSRFRRGVTLVAKLLEELKSATGIDRCIRIIVSSTVAGPDSMAAVVIAIELWRASRVDLLDHLRDHVVLIVSRVVVVIVHAHEVKVDARHLKARISAVSYDYCKIEADR